MYCEMQILKNVFLCSLKGYYVLLCQQSFVQ